MVVSWDAQPSRRLQRELCKLRLVNNRFHAPATAYLFSHASLSFDVSFLDSTSIREQIEYCTSDPNRAVLARATGLRIDLDIRDFGRHLQPLLDKRQSVSSGITAA
ncbi:hypothetical protein N658DRAFT_227933 [Parathielavia hyrcaniae]|uniref:Uncharacterized protein n=1 Tax=Parathielavia hyrcaniae TaxID=113614 RepID=A0AAN6PUX5_9PEZI|nr:hypothetical protein N658DRAFT_227933 [Parathielavia hyrcaniae]